MDRWEYKSIKIEVRGFWTKKLDVNEFDDQLNSLGSDGWELVSCFDTSQYQGESKEVIAVFKRKRG
jgi:hypothetical protein